MFISRIESYEKENALLKEQITLMSKEIKLLRVEKEVFSQRFRVSRSDIHIAP